MAIFSQERHIELVPGTEESFVITNAMTSASIPTQLPHLNIFVILVADVTDSKQDTLARVATLADLTLVPIGRDAGIAAPGVNGIEFLSQTCTVKYTTLETANDAAVAFQDRVNALIENWILYDTEFSAPDPTPATYTLPHVDASQKTALIDAYTVAKQTRYTFQVDKAAADDALILAENTYTYQQNLIPDTTTIVSDATTVQTGLSTVISQFGALLTAGNTFYGLNLAGAGFAAFYAALSTATMQQSAMSAYTAAAITNVADATAYQTARQNDATAAAATLVTAQSTQITAAQSLTSMLATESAALAAVIAVCPDFDKHSIPFVPDNEP